MLTTIIKCIDSCSQMNEKVYNLQRYWFHDRNVALSIREIPLSCLRKLLVVRNNFEPSVVIIKCTFFVLAVFLSVLHCCLKRLQ